MARSKKNNHKSRLERALEDPKLRKQYLKEVEKLFQGPKGRPGHDKDLQALHRAYGTASFEKKLKNYINTYGLPDDWSILLLLLDSRLEPDIVCKAIEALCNMSKERSTQEKKGLKSKLKVLSLTSKSPLICEAAESGLKALG